jgi:DNA replication protein DnaC
MLSSFENQTRKCKYYDRQASLLLLCECLSALNFNTTLMPKPAHFYGQDQYVQTAIDLMFQRLNNNQSANMGPGGNGKTFVALTILHNLSIKFESHIFFVSCEDINSKVALVALIAFDFVRAQTPGYVSHQTQDLRCLLLKICKGVRLSWHNGIG